MSFHRGGRESHQHHDDDGGGGRMPPQNDQFARRLTMESQLLQLQAHQEMMFLEQQKRELLQMLANMNTAIEPSIGNGPLHEQEILSAVFFPRTNGQPVNSTRRVMIPTGMVQQQQQDQADTSAPSNAATMTHQQQHQHHQQQHHRHQQQQQQQQHLFHTTSNNTMMNAVFRREDDQLVSSSTFASRMSALSVLGTGIETLRAGAPFSSDTSTTTTTYREATATPTAIFPSHYTLHQMGRWQQRFLELVAFKTEYGHSCVPSHWPQNPALAQWVKRQRSQYKLKEEGKHSNMTDAREKALHELGFVWDSHSIIWEERWKELRDFVEQYGHPNVPTRYDPNKQLALWCKCQRRQYKLFTAGDKRSNMTPERIAQLESLGFVFVPRKSKF